MMHLLEFSAVAVFVAGNAMVCSCLLLASWADTRLDEFGIAAEQESFSPQPFESEES